MGRVPCCSEDCQGYDGGLAMWWLLVFFLVGSFAGVMFIMGLEFGMGRGYFRG